jgi:hypothetical protein
MKERLYENIACVVKGGNAELSRISNLEQTAWEAVDNQAAISPLREFKVAQRNPT